ncbi:3-phosphoshikimate 1-carboxyvinyltransferase [Aliikangiella sp. IMCC44653]
MNRQITPNTDISASLTLPGSKYIANRLLPMCALAQTPSILKNVVLNDDINVAIKGLNQLGYSVLREAGNIIVKPGQPVEQLVTLDTAHSGTFSRFVSAIAALQKHSVKISCSSKMATRPMLELFSALRSLGVSVESPNNCLPAQITGPIKYEQCQLDASRSSQYLSALLIIAPLLPNGLTIQLESALVSKAYVEMTIQLMGLLGVKVEQSDNSYRVAAGQNYRGGTYHIPADPVSSTYFMAAAAISGGKVTIKDFDQTSVQGEAQFYRVLELMGCEVSFHEGDLTVSGPSSLKGISIDMSEMPDAVQTLAAVACFCEGKVTITNIAHLAYKESNRISDTAKEIQKTGIEVNYGADFLEIVGGKPHAATLETHDDHRMAMSLALLGIRTQGIVINNAQVVEKSFPSYWDVLTQIGIESQVVSS